MSSPTPPRDEALVAELGRSFPRYQPVVAVGILLAALLLGVLFAKDAAGYTLFIGTGVCLGYVLTRGAFGFAGGVKRVYITGEGGLTIALIAMFCITTLFTLGVQGPRSRGASRWARRASSASTTSIRSPCR